MNSQNLLKQQNIDEQRISQEEIMTPTSPYDENGLPVDASYLECGLPEFLWNSIRAMVEV